MADGLSHRLGTRALLCSEPCLTLEHCMLARGAAGPASWRVKEVPGTAMPNRTPISIVDDDQLFCESNAKTRDVAGLHGWLPKRIAEGLSHRLGAFRHQVALLYWTRSSTLDHDMQARGIAALAWQGRAR